MLPVAVVQFLDDSSFFPAPTSKDNNENQHNSNIKNEQHEGRSI
jgi:hypothetical protein